MLFYILERSEEIGKSCLGFFHDRSPANNGLLVDNATGKFRLCDQFFAGLKKSGTPVEVLERVRQVGPGKQGAAGSYTVYRVGEAG